MRDPSRKPRAARRRDRDKRYRQRVAAGVMTTTVEITGPVLDWLVWTKWLREDEAGDRRKVGEAISRMLADSVRRR